MTIHKLQVTGLRNLETITLEPSTKANLFYGFNGSGKTSVLEAIYFLGMNRSFRTIQAKKAIRYESDGFTVYGEVEKHQQSLPVGIKRDRSGITQIKVSGKSVKSAAELARLLPIQIIDPASFTLLEGGPKQRRQFLDWGVFHVEHHFSGYWQKMQRCLKQRNSLLRHGKMPHDLRATWDASFVSYSQQVHELRATYIEGFKDYFVRVLDSLLLDVDIEFTYNAGWDVDKEFDGLLAETLERDIKQGFTHIGPHRADLKVTHKGKPAVDVLSRGQQKLVVCSLKLAQGLMFQELTQQKCLYLIDDLPSELDLIHRKRLTKLLNEMEAQLFVTGIEKQPLVDLWNEPENVKLFHVEHGRLKEEALS